MLESNLAPAPTPIAPMARIPAVILSPSRLFQDLLRDAAWWPAFLLFVLVSLSFTATVQKQVGWGVVYDNILRSSPAAEAQFAQLPADQVAARKALSAKITSGIAWGYSLVVLLTSAIAAAVLLGTLNFALGGHARFGTLFAVYLYASVPLALKTLLAIVTLFAGLDAHSFLLSNPLGSNLGYYLPADMPRWLVALATAFDLFTLWFLVLLTLGCSIVARVSRGSAAVAVWGWWLLITLVSVASAAFRG